jgi:protein phosphatase
MPHAIELRVESCDRFRAACGTWPGRLRESNEDCAEICPEHAVLVVSDGMGRGPGGEMASRMVVARLPSLISYHLHRCDKLDPGMGRALRNALMDLNHKVRSAGSRMAGMRGIGATVVAAVLDPQGEVWTAHMGDSRAYAMHQGKLEQLTRDHSLVNSLVDRGRISPDDEGALLEHQGKLTRYVGLGGDVRADVNHVAFPTGDRLLLCTDGLTRVLSAGRIADGLSAGSPADACRSLLQAARDEGTTDNATALVAERTG